MVLDADNKVSPRPITTLGFLGTDYLVTDGLKDGERVVVNGLQKVKPGSQVTPVEAPAGATPTERH
jgi:membrane fusion protein (multidrug efflux system)